MTDRISTSFLYVAPSSALGGLVAFHYRIQVGTVPLDAQLCALLGQLQISEGGRAAYGLGDASVPAPVAAVMGPTSRAMRMTAPAGFVAFGSGLTPAGWNALARIPAAGLAHEARPAESVFGPDAQRLPAACFTTEEAGFDALDAFLRARLPAAPAPDPRIPAIDKWIISDVNGGPEALAAQLSLSRRSLERLTAHTHGATPKLLAAKYRALKAAGRMAVGEVNNWREAADLGDFVDQSHFIRDFKRFVGMTPGAFMMAEDSLVHRLMRGRWKPGQQLGIGIWSDSGADAMASVIAS